MRLTSILACILLAVSIPTVAQPRPEIWMIGFTPEVLSEPTAQWDFVKKNLDVVEMYINTIIWRTPEQMSALVKVIRQNKIKIAIECGHFDWDNKLTKDWTAPGDKITPDTVRENYGGKLGETVAKMEMAKCAKLFNAGGVPSYLNLDGPIRRQLCPGSDLSRSDIKGVQSLDRAVDNLIDYMRTWHKRFPKVQFFALTNLPNWGWKGDPAYWGTGMFYGDYYEVVQKIIDKTRAAGTPVLGITADNPYEYTRGTRAHNAWMKYPNEAQARPGAKSVNEINWLGRLLELERFVESQGLEFNLIFNSESGGMTSSELFCRQTLDYLDFYLKAGGSPKRIIIQSWLKYPEKVLPETEPNTLTWLVKEAMERATSGAGQSHLIGTKVSY